MNILEKIDTLRIERGWSYYTLAIEAGLTQSTILNMFARKTQPSIKTLEAICKAFDITLSEFFDSDKNRLRSQSERKLVAGYEKLSAKEKEAVLALIEKLGKM